MGEELLILQKEFDGFADTRERLDLLALDKKGRLVIIENKLDDSGRDVVWQAVKYAAYVSNLTKKDIINIYQQYLNKFQQDKDAAEDISEFLDQELDEVILNPSNSQRLFLVAANFRKEVTSSVLWLRKHSIDAYCFKAILYAFDKGEDKQELFVDVQLIIPPPDTEDFMIGMAEKETEEKTAQESRQGAREIRYAYWRKVLDALNSKGVDLYQNKSPSEDHWLSTGSGFSGCVYSMHFLQKEIRVNFIIATSSTEENKKLYDLLYKQKAAIENSFGHELEWRRLDDKKSSRVQFNHLCDGYDKEKWSEHVEWHVEHIQKLENALKEHIKNFSAA